ncbi:MAG: cysteine desulfurase NifS [Nanoarchaeota archaeon]|nr:cysteine desulfurase NifS [Nanoarchaeota archaeon]MCG2717594.1 cysteine desulfurase NifS [Nanoarchaeota archaeon]
MKVYLDNGATTQVAKEVAEVIDNMLTKNFGNPSSLHQFGEEANEEIVKARETIAKKINANPSEIFFTSGGTESDNLAIKGIAYAYMDKGKHIITTEIEHPAISKTCEHLEKCGFNVTYLSVDKEGFISLEKLENAITDDTILVSIIHANNEIGTIQDMKAISQLCKKKDVLFHTDAVQSFTKVPIDVKAMNIDLLSISGHKIHGPKGIGALFIRKGVKVIPLLHGGDQEGKIRSGTENTPGIVGFAKAVEIISEKDVKQMKELRDRLIDGIQKSVVDAKLNGPKGDKRLANNVNISFKYIEGESMLYHLDGKGVAVSTGSACSSQSLSPSPVLISIGLKPEDAHGSIRFTLSRYTTKEEIDYTIDSVKEIVENLRKISPLKK